MLLSRPPLTLRASPESSVRLACLMHAASVDPEPGSNSPNRLRRVATATSIRGFDRSHILVQMFPVTLQLLRCSVEARQRVAQNPDDEASPSRCQTHRWSGPGSGPVRADLRGGGTAANTRAPGRACQTRPSPGDGALPRQIGPVSTSRMNAAPLSQHSSAELDGARRYRAARHEHIEDQPEEERRRRP